MTNDPRKRETGWYWVQWYNKPGGQQISHWRRTSRGGYWSLIGITNTIRDDPAHIGPRIPEPEDGDG